MVIKKAITLKFLASSPPAEDAFLYQVESQGFVWLPLATCHSLQTYHLFQTSHVYTYAHQALLC